MRFLDRSNDSRLLEDSVFDRLWGCDKVMSYVTEHLAGEEVEVEHKFVKSAVLAVRAHMVALLPQKQQMMTQDRECNEGR